MFVVSAALASASDYAAFLRDNKQAARKLQFPLSPMPSQRIPHLSKDGRTAVARETGSSEVMSASGQNASTRPVDARFANLDTEK
ncbi:UL3.5-like protein [Gallid alphaherpesvirus 3]|uniref:UL3.5-like protein n=1 Tax=Gallid alphaherpesvirus 3 TaxID=35250 RepID=F8TBZ4_9ALPH|nr:UL3.5-like protein [Gallid alphaherpesvirus 3]AEI00205.1 UL3.5-like protein [Gallid alphaherpesvirus 3]QEY02320.1 UL3.5-like protein [Gallid alphaherpesvirus 3]